MVVLVHLLACVMCSRCCVCWFLLLLLRATLVVVAWWVTSVVGCAVCVCLFLFVVFFVAGPACVFVCLMLFGMFGPLYVFVLVLRVLLFVLLVCPSVLVLRVLLAVVLIWCVESCFACVFLFVLCVFRVVGVARVFVCYW